MVDRAMPVPRSPERRASSEPTTQPRPTVLSAASTRRVISPRLADAMLALPVAFSWGWEPHAACQGARLRIELPAAGKDHGQPGLQPGDALVSRRRHDRTGRPRAQAQSRKLVIF